MSEWTAWQFDQAVTQFGVMVQNKLDARTRFDKKGQPTYSLRDVLDEAERLLRGETGQEPVSDFDKLMAFGRAWGMV